jgi:predicted RNase H-like nuclease
MNCIGEPGEDLWPWNNPHAAKALRIADARWKAARAAARSIFSVPDKVAAYRQAYEKRREDYDAIASGGYHKVDPSLPDESDL